MCSFDGRSGINTGAIPGERNEQAWRDHLDECCSFDARTEGQSGDSFGGDAEQRKPSLDTRSERLSSTPSGEKTEERWSLRREKAPDHFFSSKHPGTFPFPLLPFSTLAGLWEARPNVFLSVLWVKLHGAGAAADIEVSF
jgi:hypothetical protein